jgi:hypothetical protein
VTPLFLRPRVCSETNPLPRRSFGGARRLAGARLTRRFGDNFPKAFPGRVGEPQNHSDYPARDDNRQYRIHDLGDAEAHDYPRRNGTIARNPRQIAGLHDLPSHRFRCGTIPESSEYANFECVVKRYDGEPGSMVKSACPTDIKEADSMIRERERD